jgi:hypothetical protein
LRQDFCPIEKLLEGHYVDYMILRVPCVLCGQVHCEFTSVTMGDKESTESIKTVLSAQTSQSPSTRSARAYLLAVTGLARGRSRERPGPGLFLELTQS